LTHAALFGQSNFLGTVSILVTERVERTFFVVEINELLVLVCVRAGFELNLYFVFPFREAKLSKKRESAVDILVLDNLVR